MDTGSMMMVCPLVLALCFSYLQSIVDDFFRAVLNMFRGAIHYALKQSERRQSKPDDFGSDDFALNARA
jgi:hypothetical protein